MGTLRIYRYQMPPDSLDLLDRLIYTKSLCLSRKDFSLSLYSRNPGPKRTNIKPI